MLFNLLLMKNEKTSFILNFLYLVNFWTLTGTTISIIIFLHTSYAIHINLLSRNNQNHDAPIFNSIIKAPEILQSHISDFSIINQNQELNINHLANQRTINDSNHWRTKYSHLISLKIIAIALITVSNFYSSASFLNKFRKYLGILRALGTSPFWFFRLFFWIATLNTLTGTLAGWLLGINLATFTSPYLFSIAALPLSLTHSALLVFTQILPLALVISFSSAIFALFKIFRHAPLRLLGSN